MKKNPKTLSEGIVDKFISNIFDNIINKRRQANKKALGKNPELKKAEDDLAKSYSKFKKTVEDVNAMRDKYRKQG
jgi:hypothetical protein